MISIVDALIMLALIGSVLLKKFAILLLRWSKGGEISRVSIGMGLLMLLKVHLACWVFNFSTFRISLLVAMFITLVGGETQSRLLGVLVYFVP